MAAITLSHKQPTEALIRATAKACLKKGLSKEGTTFVLQSVQCKDIGIQLKKERTSYKGKLTQVLQTGAAGQYFIMSGHTEPAFKPDLIALISQQHMTQTIRTILSNLRMGTGPMLLPMRQNPTSPNMSNGTAEGNASSSQSAATPPKPCQPRKHVRLTTMYKANANHRALL